MLALVTGASGFLGGALVRALGAGGHRVRALVRERSDASALDPAVEVTEKVERMLGFSAPTPLADSVARSARYYRERGWL